ncbi:SDR family oxidoreductase [Jeotgalibaca sp. A122]|uniref:SDR family oxidoreductase n=1 Tax=Jeotgalibaca sp. A122 TaxID=3457322 RepID=UPI003FD11357
MDLGLKGKNALIIASSQGLGKAVATELVKEGANVMLTSRSEDALREVQEELELLGEGRVTYFPCDITKPEEIKALVAETQKRLGTINILLNNAGGPPSGVFDDFEDEAWQRAFELNLLSYIRIIREVLPDLRKEGGRIVNVASISVKTPMKNLILSNTFRNGIVGLSKSLAEELGPDNILVNVAAPGTIGTGRIAQLNKNNAEKQGVSVEDIEKETAAKIPLGRMGRPQEFGKAVAFLLSDANTYITGSTILVDGGMAKVIS